MSFFDKIKEIVTESDDDEYDDFYEDDKKDKSIGIAPPARDRFSRGTFFRAPTNKKARQR